MPRNTISIVMPAKNAEAYIEACLDSILAQSINDWELLVVNDHSSDGTGKILADYALKDARIRVFDNLRQGIIPALQKAYSASNGDFISRMDADDLMAVPKLELMRAALEEKGPKHLAIGLVSYFSETGLGDGYKKYQDWLNGLSIKSANFKDIYKECVVPSPCWMLHRKDFEDLGAFNSDVYPEDYDLCFRFYEAGLSCIGIPETLHYWRDYASRSSRTDPNYADNRFLDLKLHYFLKLEHQANGSLVLWGAGKKAKLIAKGLLKAEVPFHWLCNNEQKIGKDIYDCRIKATTDLKNLENTQVIIAVAGETAQLEIKEELKSYGLVHKDFFFFC